jgi:LuxR family maltose regulon positive regulatory protein
VVAASRSYAETVRASQASGNIPVALIALGQLSQLQAMQGQLHQAAGTYRQALDLASRRGLTTLPALGVAQVSMGEVLREWNDLDEAERLLLEGIEHCQQRGGLAECALDGLLSLARVFQARGEIDGALRVIQQAEQIGRDFHSARLSASQAKLWLVQGHVPAVTEWAAALQRELDEGSELASVHLDGYTVLARLHMVRGELKEAIQLLGRLLQIAESTGLIGQAIEVLVLQALSFQAQANLPQTMQALVRALELAGPQGYVRIFVDEGEPMLALLHHAASRGVAPDYLDKLLAAFGTTAQQISSPLPAVLLDPLSEREREILRLIAAGLSTDEIANELVITVGTVRNHIKHIYSKLDAHSRLQAVERARTLNLL